ncbi:MAG: hypothetical protein LAP40_13320 [Acidobacteriia bacterium]|nr:hypothetical protein [Terriglobia bacterium]
MNLRCVVSLICFSGVAVGQTAGENLQVADILARVTKTENTFLDDLAKYKPLVETYVQFLTPDPSGSEQISDDAYFIGNAEFRRSVDYQGFNPDKTFGSGVLDFLRGSKKPHLVPRSFARMALIDPVYFTTERYDFENPHGEFLGAVRCIVFDVKPKPKEPAGRFIGRIWVEDRTFHVVRFSGTYTFKHEGANLHFNSYREQVGPGLWLPSITYIEESDSANKQAGADLKGLVRFWSYASNGPHKTETFTNIVIDAPEPPQDAAANELSRTEALRDWERQAEDNTIQRMEKAGLIGPPGDVEKVLDTVLNNLMVTNKITVDPPIRTRVLLTTPLESFTVGHTLLVSRGLIDVLPNEASLAAVVSRELAAVVLGFKSNTMNAFSDRMLFDDTQIFRQFVFRRSSEEDVQANRKALDILRNSPYAPQLPGVGLFLKALVAKNGALTNLTQARIGNPVASEGVPTLLSQLIAEAPKLTPNNKDQIEALPLLSRIRLDAWSNSTEMIRAKAVPLLSANEKMPFEVMPVVLTLKRQDEPASRTLSATK